MANEKQNETVIGNSTDNAPKTNTTGNTDGNNGADTLVQDTVSPTPTPDSADTADMNHSLTPKETNTKPGSFKAIPVTSSKKDKDGKIMPTFVLKSVPGVIQPKAGDSVRFVFGKKTYVGTVNSISSTGVIALNVSK